MNEQIKVLMMVFQITPDEIVIPVQLVVLMDQIQDIVKQDPIDKSFFPIFITRKIFYGTF
jgi:hypothetical protein